MAFFKNERDDIFVPAAICLTPNNTTYRLQFFQAPSLPQKQSNWLNNQWAWATIDQRVLRIAKSPNKHIKKPKSLLTTGKSQAESKQTAIPIERLSTMMTIASMGWSLFFIDARPTVEEIDSAATALYHRPDNILH